MANNAGGGETGALVSKWTTPEAREACYLARDAYHACLDRTGEKKTECTAELGPYKDMCMPSWRKHFDAKRLKDKRHAIMQKPQQQ